MPSVLHKTLPDSELHEPKGVANAVNKTVYRAKGAGSGNWVKITPQMLQGVSTVGNPDQPITMDGNGNFVVGTTSVNGFGRANKAVAGGSTSMWTLTANANNVNTLAENVSLTATGIKVAKAGIFKVTLTFDPAPQREDGQTIFNCRVYRNSDVVLAEVLMQNQSSGRADIIVRMNANDEIRVGPWNVPANRTSESFYYSVNRVGV